MEQKIQAIYQAIMDGAMANTADLVTEAIDAKIPADTILQEGLIAPMGEIGKMFETGDCYVPEMLVSAKSMKFGLEVLRPELVAADVKPVGKVVIGTVQGDLHDIGKNLVGMMLEGAGFEVIDLGVDVKPEDFLQAAKDHKPDLIALSALLTTTMGNMEKSITLLEEAGIRSDLKVIIGGAPVTQEFADQIGADGYSIDASQAATLAKNLI